MAPLQPSQQSNLQTLPLLKVPYHVSKSFIRNHTEWSFIFGNDLYNLGALGQAWNCVGEPNCFQVPTLFKYCPANKIFFDDYNPDCKKEVDKALGLIPLNNPIIVLPKIGAGCSMMNVYAPRLFAYLHEQLNKIKYKNVEVIYVS